MLIDDPVGKYSLPCISRPNGRARVPVRSMVMHDPQGITMGDDWGLYCWLDQGLHGVLLLWRLALQVSGWYTFIIIICSFVLLRVALLLMSLALLTMLRDILHARTPNINSGDFVIVVGVQEA